MSLFHYLIAKIIIYQHENTKLSRRTKFVKNYKRNSCPEKKNPKTITFNLD